MNYKFLTVLTVAASMYMGVKADTPALSKQLDLVKQPETTSAILKIGYVNLGYLLENLPEAKKRSAEIQSFQKQLDNEINVKVDEYKTKMEAAQQQLDTLTEFQKKQKSIELSKLQSIIEELESQKYGKIEQRYREIMKPLYDAIQEVVNQIAKEKQYTFVFSKNTETGPVLMFAESAFDLSEAVLEKIKLEEKKEVVPPVVGPKSKPVAKTPTKETKKAVEKPAATKKAAGK
ncbi:MAG: OmpH family outer membrane protein [Amoebophilaceae bacterium]|nr:OmpH family outer membrane protein [Amoebophilaceae bacterium]